jgi:hypothetical protein
VLVVVKVLGSIGENCYTVTTIVCSDCCSYKSSAERGRRNTGLLNKIKFWKKRNNNTQTKVDICVSTDDPRTCNDSTVTTDPTVMCAAYTQTETRMDDGGAAAAAKEEYEHQIEMKDQKIRELEEELALSKRLTADLMLNMTSVEHQVRKYAEKPIINWSDDCECKQQVLAVADLLKKIIVTHRDTKKSKPHLARTTKLTAKPKQKQTAGRGIVPAGTPNLTAKPKQTQTAGRGIVPAGTLKLTA